MRIAYFTGEYPRATDTFIQREVAELRRLGHDVTTIAVRQPGSQHIVGAEQEAEVERTHYLLPASPFRLIRSHVLVFSVSPSRYFTSFALALRTRQPGIRGLIFQMFYFLEAGLLCTMIRRHNITHVHNHFANSSCSVTMLASVMGEFDFSFTMHGPAIFYEPRRWCIDEKIARAKFVACISHFCRSQGMAFSQLEHWSKLRIVHCGVDPSLFDLSVHSGRGTRLIYVGRLAAVKGLPVLLEAMARLPDDISLTVAGDGEDRLALEVMTSHLGLDGRVEYLGYCSQIRVRELLSESDIFVMSSFAEGVPVVLMEAMAGGIPVVATRIAGIAELVEDGHSGLMIPPGDVESLTKALEKLIDDPELRNRFGRAGRSMIEREFNGGVEASWLVSIMTGQAIDAQLRPDRSDLAIANAAEEKLDKGAA